MHEEKIDRWMVAVFIDSHRSAPEEIVLDLDATDDPIHGNQEGRFYHGYYGNYCYLPLYIFSVEHLLCARLRRSNIDGAEGAVDELNRIVGQIRQAWPAVKVVIRADSGFCRDDLLSWCEQEPNGIDYVIGLAKNVRLNQEIAEDMKTAEALFTQTGKSARVFKDFRYRTRDSWSCERRVVEDGDFRVISSDPNPWFSHQHDAEFEGPGVLSLYDNGNTRRAADSAAHSRGQVYRLDETQRTATLLVNADLGAYSNALGSAQQLCNGGYSFNSGNIQGGPVRSQTKEILPNGSVGFSLDNPQNTYRTFRMKSMYEQ